LCKDFLKGKPLSREGRIAKARNVGLDELYKLEKTDYVIMIDMDSNFLNFIFSITIYFVLFYFILFYFLYFYFYMFQILLLLLFIIVLGWDVNGIVNSFNYHTIWDVVCANGLMFHGEYRDTYAFRTPSKYT